MNIRDLKYILAVAELKHFGKAAERCFVSQPTLSSQIKKLEDELGITLFERTKRQVMLTDAGEKIIASAKHVMTEIENLYSIAESTKDPFSGKLRLAAIPSLGAYLFPTVVSEVRQDMPGLKLVLEEEKTEPLLLKLKSGEIDAGLIATPVNDEQLLFAPLFEDEFLLAVPADHELANESIINQDQLMKYKLLLLEEGHCMRDQALEVCRLHAIAEEHDTRATGIETLRLMVKAGTGITFMPKVAVNPEDIGIKYISLSKPVPKRTIAMVWRKTSGRTEAIKNLASIVIDAFKTKS